MPHEKNKKRFSLRSLLLVVALLGLINLTYSSGLIPGLPPKSEAVTEDWIGHSELSSQGSLTTVNNAVIVSATTLNGVNARLQVKAIVMTGATAGNYVFFSGSTPSGANQIGNFYLAANTPVSYNADNLRGVGMRSASGQGIYCVGPGVLTWQVVVRQDTSQ